MQITIDTQKDSKKDIRKAVAFLSSISEGKEPHSNIFEDSSNGLDSAGENAFANMFGDDVKGTPVLGKDLKDLKQKTDEAEDKELPGIVEY